MLYSIAHCFFNIKENIPYSSWLLFSENKIESSEDITYIQRKECDNKEIRFTVNNSKNKTILFPKTEKIYVGEQLLYQYCATVLLMKGVLHLHSSFALYNGKALIFAGPSGVGKTTQAELWRDFQDALIVNGDACLLRQMDAGQWWAFGTPIHGSSLYCENEKAPIAAIITLEQGEENVLTRMDDFSALSYCLPEFYRPKMDEETEETFWDSVDSLFRSVPVYHLVCRPDQEATEIVKKEIFDV